MNKILAIINYAGLVVFLMAIMSCTDESALRSVYTAQIGLDDKTLNPYSEIDLKAVFVKPGGDSVWLSGFYDGNGTYKIRAYCGEAGKWRWTTISNIEGLHGRKGKFIVKPSALRGKLRIHDGDPHQFMYDNGDWFLHIGDTGYRYLIDTEENWQEYIDQAASMGATKIRCWFARSRHTVEALFNEDRSGLNLSYWQEMEKRLDYALDKYPDLIFQLIPFAEDDQEMFYFKNEDFISRKAIDYMQARWSAYPNLTYCISNDRNINGRDDLKQAVRFIGDVMQRQEPWGTLITNHQKRYQGYAFVDDSWSDIITLEDIDQVHGQLVLDCRERGNAPVVLDEDRYENWRNPLHDRYFFRRLMWANLLSGGHPTYGGLRTYEPFEDTLTPQGIMGYYTATEYGLLEKGAHDFVHIHKFFTDKDLDLVNWIPSDSLAGNDPAITKCTRKEYNYIVYLQNPDDPVNHVSANVSDSIPEVVIDLKEAEYLATWFCPRSGTWDETDTIQGKEQAKLTAPGGKDWVLYLAMKE